MNSRSVIITGARGNLGAAVARAFLATGANLVLVDHATHRLEQSFAALADSPNHLLLGGVDLGDEAAVARVVTATVERFGAVDVLVHTVGTWRGGQPVHEAALSDWTFLQETNLRTTLLAVRAVLPPMLAQRRGKIIGIGARTGLAGEAQVAAYSATKAAVLRLLESVSAEVKASGINVNAILPSIIDTPQNRAAMPGADYSRWVAPAALADVVVFLASDAARAIHGATIPVYGLS
jgi:NAD(P)-dependent dehydrogenase (short-subunit alcohol dehydrogenase family)